MAAKLPDLNDLFNSLPSSQERLRYSTDFTQELIAEFDTQRRKMHQELEAQRIALERGYLQFKEPADSGSAEADMPDPDDQANPRSTSPAKPRKGGNNFKTLRKNILQIWRNNEVTGKGEAVNMRRAKSWNTKEDSDSSRAIADKKSKFSTWKGFSFPTCTEDTTDDS
ncbi:hypothetical protein K493DRAFT_303997 [Basidiobolus meristosporus CBS 931.73]|uniref:Uncharacterized protein n=1 Tax=Basidiobolus meristosporus CBS 931.73 TaxID=1314790 RepID=A0A1Y1Y0Q9_9FUNG|nr:hypothetical protein K493DRAFT_303997 [Basidiobolus meristosporus CBS 931.73]|eukprot:ORX91549.1 hypothetical protein K493DRAFT_303997 [Basidiobolus meristosporus CBS 931.73]